MYSVFSKKLFEFRDIVEGSSLGYRSLADTIDVLKDKLTYTTAVFTVNSNVLENEAEDAIELIHSNRELKNVILWINKKILKEIKNISLATLDVRLRIATGMLNKVDIKPIVSVIMHDNFVRNLRALYFDLKMEDLPF